MSPAFAVDIQEVTHRYGSHPALCDVTVQVEAGALYGLLGPNGSGKTTLFRILSTLLPPKEGTAQVFGFDTTEQPQAVRQRLGMVFQDEALDGALTVRENLRFQGALYDVRGPALRERMSMLLETLNVADRVDDRVEDLSGGLRRRVDLARGLLHRPDLLLLDEPTSGLDPAARRTFWGSVERLKAEEGTTLLVATHLMDEAERCDRVGILSDGSLVTEGAPRDLKAELGEETLWLETDDPSALCKHIEAQFGVTTRIVGSSVQVAAADPPAFLSSLYEVVGDRIRTATIRTPTLDDVFMVHADSAPPQARDRVLTSASDTDPPA